MKVLIVMSTPNASGLTAACAESARQGVVDSRSRARVVNLNELSVARCAVCGDGWGTCRKQHECQVKDDFQELHRTVREAEGYVFVTPVYFGEPSEPFKAFFDRLRRCEATRDPSSGERGALTGKPAVCVAAAGGSGHGAVRCLECMERTLHRLGAEVLDLIPVTQRTREYQLETVHDAQAVLTETRAAPATRPETEARRGGRKPRRRRRR
ncbi:MAG: flavodoxin family protein [Candidatus Bipolaricaulota bacterium]|nr:MAG: flavodoxin family protein [Candidatus Bipolaricaulota bacterium]